jgi:hypothetical protein
MTGTGGASNPLVKKTDSGIVASSEIGLENTLKVETRVQVPLGLQAQSSTVPARDRRGPDEEGGPTLAREQARDAAANKARSARRRFGRPAFRGRTFSW